MVHQVTNFLLRWLFLCRLVDDRAEIQTWPYRPPGYYEHHHPPPPPNQYPQQQHESQQQHIHEGVPVDDAQVMDMPTYRESIIRSITSYPPGSTERLQKLDELRLLSVREFAQQLLHADEVIRWGVLKGYTDNAHHPDDAPGINNEFDLDEDVSIQNEFEQFIRDEHSETLSHTRNRWNFLNGHDPNPKDTDVKSSIEDDASMSNPLKGLTPDQIHHSLASAHKLISEARDFLPQLVSTVLHSPPALLPDNLSPDPISSLRSLIIHRCQTNPSLGIELCWLLEAEVGRKWKALFEHRQQTGKRLILIVQADIAAAIATIGAEKASAFNLLQDAEMATAFGMDRMYEDHMGNIHTQQQYSFSSYTGSPAGDTTGGAASSRPPRSISDLRCRHFGDSMHFVDRLTQISLDLRHVPPVHRRTHLQSRLAELNQRLCRRMATRGRISIDVESIEEGGHMFTHWSENNVREDMIHHSVHFPMEPQSVRWPGGNDAAKSDFEHPSKRNGVVRTLRVLPDMCRVLDSRERCPFLVRMEVVETGLEANDARLYAADVQPGVGLTIEETLGSTRPHGNSILKDSVTINGGFASCEIPPELMREHAGQTTVEASSPTTRTDESNEAVQTSNDKAVLSRGGYQSGNDNSYEPPDMHGTFDMVQEQFYDQVHHDMHHQREQEYYQPSSPTPYSKPSVSMGPDLLNRVFGRPWADECESIRKQSPYRNVKGWRLASFIIKAGEDIRKEALVMQIMSKLWTYFQAEIPPHLRPYLRPYTIMCTGGDAGIVECLPDVKSVNEVKKETDGFTTLNDFFERAFGPYPPFQPGTSPGSAPAVSLEKARDNFLRSLVGYSVVCYILQIKDRHNANILMDREGHIMHIDFGFVLGETPKMGKVPLFSERAPFKLSAEFWEVIGGWKNFKRFCEMFEAAYAVAASHSDEICSLVEAAIMNVSRNTDLARSLSASVRGRLQMMNDPIEQKRHIMNIVNDAITSWGTSTYDWLQRSMNGYQ